MNLDDYRARVEHIDDEAERLKVDRNIALMAEIPLTGDQLDQKTIEYLRFKAQQVFFEAQRQAGKAENSQQVRARADQLVSACRELGRNLDALDGGTT